MFNIQPGQGLGFIGNNEIALGLGRVIVGTIGNFIKIVLIVISEYIKQLTNLEDSV